MADEAVESASLTVIRLGMGSYEFAIMNYSRYNEFDVNKELLSEEFMAGGYRWAICIYPRGKKGPIYKDGYISLFIVFKSEFKHPVPFLYELYTLDQSGRGNHCSNNWFNAADAKFVPPASFCPSASEFFNFIRRYTLFENVPAARWKSAMFGPSNFIKRASLESMGYLKDDCLKINCTIVAVSSHIQNLPLIEVPESNIGSDFRRLLESKQGADVFFKVEGESFCTHKSILAARCPAFWWRYFFAMQPQVFKAMLPFIYTGTFLEEKQKVFGDKYSLVFDSFLAKMLAAADEFELETLKKICESRMVERLSGETVAYLFHLAHLYHAKELKAACLRFAAENQGAMMESEGSKYLKEICPSLFLDLTGYKENPEVPGQLSPRGRKEQKLSKILSTVKKSFVCMFQPLDTVDKKQK